MAMNENERLNTDPDIVDGTLYKSRAGSNMIQSHNYSNTQTQTPSKLRIQPKNGRQIQIVNNEDPNMQYKLRYKLNKSQERLDALKEQTKHQEVL